MKKISIIISILFICLGITIGCDLIMPSSKIKGKVINPLSGEPFKGIKIIATTKTNIAEERKKSKLETITDDSGDFLLKGALPNKKYRIIASKDGYVSSIYYAKSPEKGKTRLIDKPIYILKNPPSRGLFIVNKDGSQIVSVPKKHENYLDFKINRIPIWKINDTDIILIHCGNISRFGETISQLNTLKIKKKGKSTISFSSTKEGFKAKSIRIGRGSNGKIVVLKVTIPPIKETTYYGAYAGFSWRQTYVFGVDKK